jgi:hypothetical protein
LAHSIPSPTISAISPASGYPQGGTNITITGTNFIVNNQVVVYAVEIGGLNCVNINILDSNNLSCVTPANSVGFMDVVVKTWGGLATNSGGFEYKVCTSSTAITASGGAGIVNIECHMIPIKYAGSTAAPIWQKADITNASEDWFDYEGRKWANAVTLDDSTQKYNTAGGAGALTPLVYFRDHAPVGMIIPEADILGYWVYIPRYAYEVQRRDAVDKPITSQTLFDIRFETKTDGIKTPIATTSTTTTHNDYRTARSAYRSYPGHDITSATSTWATHPAFWWDKDNDGTRDGDEELNGIWVGKFETTGSQTRPTIKPGIKSQINQYIGAQFAIARGIGPLKNGAMEGGNSGQYGANYHNFAQTADNLNVHQQKSTEWGAAAYLSTSIYGVGSTNSRVQNNSYYNSSLGDGNGETGYGVTGCGPGSSGSDAQQTTACSHYYTALGQLGSTTQNVYGVYDMAGGAWEYVMGNRTTSVLGATSIATYMATSPELKYLSLYGAGITLPNILGTGSLENTFGTKPSWSSGSSEIYYNWDICVWETCGGQALSETISVQSVTGDSQAWGTDRSNFVDSSSQWFVYGGASFNTSDAGLYALNESNGSGSSKGVSFRASLVGF